MNGIELSETTQKLSELPPPEGEGFGSSGALSSPDSVGRNSRYDGWVMTPVGAAPACCSVVDG